MKEKIEKLQEVIGYQFKDPGLLTHALTHSSYANEHRLDHNHCNERLEFLGDAVLSTIVADILFKKFPNKKEGFLSNTRSKIVKRDTLNDIAIKMGLDKLVQTSIRTNTHNNYIYGNAFEAFIGAIYLDQGYETCKTFIQDRIIAPYIDLSVIARKEVNFKSKLIEWGQKNHIDISFSLIEAFTDKENNPIFQFQAILAGTPCGIGIGYSKKEAQQNAAQIALSRVKNDQTFAQSILNAQKSFELNLSKKENDGNFREQFSSFTKQDSSDKSYEY